MGYINKNVKRAFIGLFVMSFILPAEGYAYTSLLWRVESDITQTAIVEPYNGGKTPFPYEEAPEPVEVVFEPSAEDMERQKQEEKRALLASELLSEIRNIMDNESAFNPDITTAHVGAVLKGEKGYMALIDKKWFNVNDTLSVPVKAKSRLNALIATLSSLDPKLSEDIRQELETKYKEVQAFELTVKEIGEDYVTLTDADERLHVINFTLEH